MMYNNIYISLMFFLFIFRGGYGPQHHFFFRGDLAGDLGGALSFAGDFTAAAFAASLPVVIFVRLAPSLRPLAALTDSVALRFLVALGAGSLPTLTVVSDLSPASSDSDPSLDSALSPSDSLASSGTSASPLSRACFQYGAW